VVILTLAMFCVRYLMYDSVGVNEAGTRDERSVGPFSRQITETFAVTFDFKVV
jgi:hypothetical protein